VSTNHERIDKARSTYNVQIMGTDGAANGNAMIEFDEFGSCLRQSSMFGLLYGVLSVGQKADIMMKCPPAMFCSYAGLQPNIATFSSKNQE